MKKFIFISFSITILFLTGCTQLDNENLQLENRLLQKELKLKEKELQLKQEELEIKTKKEKSISELYQENKEAVFLIYTVNTEGVSQGSGFVIHPSGIAISNYHVFEDASIVIADFGEEDIYMITELLAASEELDYVIFKIGEGQKQFPFVVSSDIDSKIGEESFAIGNPEGLTKTLSMGIISGYRGDLIQTTTEITHGSSGGALFNRLGKVIGVTTSGFGEANLNFAVNIRKIPFEKYLSNDYVASLPETTISDEKSLIIKNLFIDYYDGYIEEDYEKIYTFFSPNLKRFFYKFNFTNEEAVQSLEKDRKASGILSVNPSILWDSFEIEKTLENTHLVRFKLDYKVERIDKTKPTEFLLDITAEVNENNKISSIYEDILVKYNVTTYDKNVEVIQNQLNFLGYNLEVDGYFGPKTSVAVIDFQRKNGLDPDGTVGPLTLEVLFAK